MFKYDINTHPLITDMQAKECNQWFIDNVGELIYDNPGVTLGKGWKIEWEGKRPNDRKWYLTIEEEAKAMLFVLRWL
jgi:hypothetical protein